MERNPLHCGKSSVMAASSCCLLPRSAQARIWRSRALGKDSTGSKTRGPRGQTCLSANLSSAVSKLCDVGQVT